MNNICTKIAKEVGSLFNCSEFKDFIQIETPFNYPDGDIIDIFYRKVNNGFILTDLGETLRWLESQSSLGTKNNRQEEFIESICLSNDLTIKKDMLISIRTKRNMIK